MVIIDVDVADPTNELNSLPSVEDSLFVVS